MSSKKWFGFLLITFITIVGFAGNSFAQTNTQDKNAKILAFKNMVDSQHFVFVAQSASPLRGNFRNLTSEYDVTVSNDTMISYLPYFGRAYTAPVTPSQSGLDFTSTKFSYEVTAGKKNAWMVSIKPKDHQDVQQYLFTIYDNGSASLNVTSVSRDAISFLGHIQKAARKKKK